MTLTLPDLLPFLDGTPDALDIALDWLRDGCPGSTPRPLVPPERVLPALLLAYRGEPPEYLGESWEQDEALRRLVGAWCRETGPREIAFSTPIGNEGISHTWRWEAVLACEAVSTLDGLTAHGAALIRREQKRRVLALFPDVTLTATAFVPQSEGFVGRLASELTPSLRWDLSRKYPITRSGDEYRQAIPAPDWIPPEFAQWQDYHSGLQAGVPSVFCGDDPLVVETSDALQTGDWVMMDDWMLGEGGWRVRRTDNQAEAIGQALEAAPALGRVRVALLR